MFNYMHVTESPYLRHPVITYFSTSIIAWPNEAGGNVSHSSKKKYSYRFWETRNKTHAGWSGTRAGRMHASRNRLGIPYPMERLGSAPCYTRGWLLLDEWIGCNVCMCMHAMYVCMYFDQYILRYYWGRQSRDSRLLSDVFMLRSLHIWLSTV